MSGYVDPRYAAVRDRAVSILLHRLPSLTALSLTQLLALEHRYDQRFYVNLAVSIARNELIGPEQALPVDFELAAQEVSGAIAGNLQTQLSS